MKLKRAIFASDMHHPASDKVALNLLLDVCAEVRPDVFIIGGDYQDCKCISKYRKTPNKAYAQLEYELEVGLDFLSSIEKRSRASKLIYLSGNHEHRILNYIYDNAFLLASYIKQKEILKIPPSWRFIEYGQNNHYTLGPLICTHGVFFNKHVAFSMLSKYDDVIFGHTHRTQIYTLTKYPNRLLRAYNVGWLADMKTAGDYMNVHPDWSQSFAVIFYNASFYSVQIIQIINGRAVYGQKFFKQP